jgi:glycosyltransferase involved in cell wall biosynthesis
MISVIVPTYMEERYIEACLKSIRKQDFDDKIEVIVADSNSKDRTRQIARKYAKRVVNIKERGISRGRNAGFEASKGEIVVFLDADTRMGPSFVSEIAKRFEDKNVVGVFPNLLSYDGSFAENFTHRLLCHGVKVLNYFGKPFFPICAAYRRDAFQKAGGFNEGIIVGEELDLSFRVGKFGKCVCSNEAIAYTSLRRFRKSGIMKSVLFQGYCYFRLFILKKPSSISVYPHTEEILKNE